jgi:hypothetical protein
MTYVSLRFYMLKVIFVSVGSMWLTTSSPTNWAAVGTRLQGIECEAAWVRL